MYCWHSRWMGSSPTSGPFSANGMHPPSPALGRREVNLHGTSREQGLGLALLALTIYLNVASQYGGVAMQSAKRASARPVRRAWWCLPLMLGFVLVRPNALLQAASNVAAVADAARADDLPAVRKLIKEHADVNTPANDGSSALLWAAYHSDVEMTKALLAAGAAVDAANHYGVTPLLQASRNGDVEVMRALLDAGAEPTRWHAEGETPLMAAARTGKRGRG